jgi:hypothetical protein
MNAVGTGTNSSIKIGTDNITFTVTGGVGPTGATGADGKGYVLSTTSYNPSSAWSIGSSRSIVTSTAPSTTAFVVGSRIRVSRTSSNYIEGVIVALDNQSPYGITLNVDKVVGSSSSAVHTISIAGEIGSTGATGSAGSTGPTGASGTDGNDGLGYILSTYAESNTSVWSVGSSKRFRTTVAPNTTAFVVGTRVRITRSTGNYVEGVITALDNDSGSTGGTGYGITLTIDIVSGTGGSTSCTVSVAGNAGTNGANGADGTPGVSWVTAPTNYNSTGTVGQFAYSGSYLYACISSNRWIRITASAISSNFTSGGGD